MTNLSKTEIGVGFAARSGKTTGTMLEKIDVDVSALSYSAGVAYFGDVTISKVAKNKGASLDIKFGVTTGAGQVLEHVVHITSNDGKPTKVENVLLSSTANGSNVNARFTGYVIPWT